MLGRRGHGGVGGVGLRRLLDDIAEVWRYFRAPTDPEGRAFDARFGTETRWFDWSGSYEPCPPSRFARALDALDVDGSESTFVDLGCGKGRALILAALRPFRAVVGLEYRPELVAVARRNLAAAARREPACGRVRLIEGDAAAFTPPDGPLVVFLYNPFGADLVEAVLSRTKGPARLVYLTPLHEERVRKLGWRRLAGDGEGLEAWGVYAGPG